MVLTGTREEAIVEGNSEFPVNKGALCIMDWTSTAALTHPDRQLAPLVRDEEG